MAKPGCTKPVDLGSDIKQQVKSANPVCHLPLAGFMTGHKQGASVIMLQTPDVSLSRVMQKARLTKQCSSNCTALDERPA